jgi:hypothetical protein
MSMSERYDYEARIVDERLDAERYVRSWVDGYGEVRFTLSPWGRCGMRMFGKRVPLDPVVRSAGVILATAWV